MILSAPTWNRCWTNPPAFRIIQRGVGLIIQESSALDSGELRDGKPFLVMQFVKGVTLREEITPRGMHLERSAFIVRQLHTPEPR